MIQSPLFWAVLLATLLIYWLSPSRFRFTVLTVCSIAYLMSLDWFSVVSVLMGSIGVWKLTQTWSDKSHIVKRWSWLVFCLIAWLFVFKSLGGLLQSHFEGSMIVIVLVPLGISYYTFKLIHFVVERHRGLFGDITLSNYLAWLMFIPIFTAGPIEPLEHFNKHISSSFKWVHISEGGWRIIYGLIKKFVLVDLIIIAVLMQHRTINDLVTEIHTVSPLEMWAYLVFLYLYFYLEFSAYSDIAIGSAKLFGISIVENFNWPFLATDVSKFWKRWHMSLANWCQRYVYMPTMAQSRKPMLAIFSTFFVMGMWHALNTNYFIWGIYHAIGVATVLQWSKYKRKKGINSEAMGWLRYWGWAPTFVFVCVGWVFSSTSGSGLEPVFIILSKLIGMQ